MRIVHVIARLNVGGAALSVLELAAAQQARGHDVLVVAGTVPPGEASMVPLAEDLGVPHLHMPELRRELSLRDDLIAIRRLRALLRARETDVLQTHTSKAGATGRIAALLAGRRRPRALVHTFHGHVLSGYFDFRREQVFRLLERSLARRTDAVIAVSDEVRDDLVRMRVAPAGKIFVVRYGFDFDRRLDASDQTRESSRALLGVAPDALVVGWAGRLTAIKRPLDLVRTIARVDGALLVLAGDGELRAGVEALAAELKVSERVRLLGYVDPIGPWYAAFDAFLLTSANEGTPVVAIESLAAAVPVVATDAGGTRTVIDDGETGFVVPVGDVRALAACLDRLKNRDLRKQFGAEGARRMRERFSTERMVDDVQRIYDRILAR